MVCRWLYIQMCFTYPSESNMVLKGNEGVFLEVCCSNPMCCVRYYTTKKANHSPVLDPGVGFSQLYSFLLRCVVGLSCIR